MRFMINFHLSTFELLNRNFTDLKSYNCVCLLFTCTPELFVFKHMHSQRLLGKSRVCLHMSRMTSLYLESVFQSNTLFCVTVQLFRLKKEQQRYFYKVVFYFQSLVHYCHGRKHGGTQADMMLER